MEEIYNWIAQNMNYAVVTFFMAVESSFIPFPSEIIIIPAAYVAINHGTMSLPLIIFFGTLGALIGALINYGLSVWLGRKIIYKFADTKTAHWLLIDKPSVIKAEEYFKKHGAIGTLVGRLIPAIRQLISIPAGLARMNMSTFLLYTSLGAAAWNTVLTLIGAIFGKTMPEQLLIEQLMKYGSYVKAGIAVIVIIIFVIYIRKVLKANEASIKEHIQKRKNDLRTKRNRH